MKFSFLVGIFIFLGYFVTHGMETSEKKFDQDAAQLIINRLLLYQFALIKSNLEIPSCKPSKEDMNKLRDFLDETINIMQFKNLKRDKNLTFFNLLVEELSCPSVNDIQFIISPVTPFCRHNNEQMRAALCAFYKECALIVKFYRPYNFSETVKKQLPKTYNVVTGKTSDKAASTMQDIDETLAKEHTEQMLLAYTHL